MPKQHLVLEFRRIDYIFSICLHVFKTRQFITDSLLLSPCNWEYVLTNGLIEALCGKYASLNEVCHIMVLSPVRRWSII